MNDHTTLSAFLQNLPLVILALGASTATAFAVRFWVEKSFWRGMYFDDTQYNRKVLWSILERANARTSGSLHYGAIKCLLGEPEAIAYHGEAVRLAGKLGLMPGYYRVDDSGNMIRVTASSIAEITSQWQAPASRSYNSNKRTKMNPNRRMRILNRDNFRCQLCGRTATDDGEVTLHIDHKMPVSRGGTDDDENLWVLCADCNIAKADRTVEELMASQSNNAEGGEQS